MSGRLEDFTLEQLSIMIVAVMGACAGLLAVVFRSKCSSISCCGIKIERDPEAITDPDVQKEVVAQRRASINNLPNLPQHLAVEEDPRP